MKDTSEFVKSAQKQLIFIAGKSLHRLGASKPKESTVETMVEAFPDAMKVLNAENQFPIQSCISVAYDHALKYIPLLVREGMKHNIGDEGKHGRLLTLDPSSKNGTLNTLQAVVQIHHELAQHEGKSLLKVLERLEEDGHLRTEDVMEQNLLQLSAQETCQLQFKFLLSMDPQSIDNFAKDGNLFMHWLIDQKDLNCFKAVLKVTLDLYPEQAGYLFQKDTDGQQAALERAIQKYGEKEIMTFIHEIISAKRFPILHHALIMLRKHKVSSCSGFLGLLLYETIAIDLSFRPSWQLGASQ